MGRVRTWFLLVDSGIDYPRPRGLGWAPTTTSPLTCVMAVGPLAIGCHRRLSPSSPAPRARLPARGVLGQGVSGLAPGTLSQRFLLGAVLCWRSCLTLFMALSVPLSVVYCPPMGFRPLGLFLSPLPAATPCPPGGRPSPWFRWPLRAACRRPLFSLGCPSLGFLAPSTPLAVAPPSSWGPLAPLPWVCLGCFVWWSVLLVIGLCPCWPVCLGAGCLLLCWYYYFGVCW